MGLADAVEHAVAIEGLVALLYTVTDISDPIEVGGQTTYEIHVVNQGSKTASNLRVGAMIPAGMEAINGEGPTRVLDRWRSSARLIRCLDWRLRRHVLQDSRQGNATG